MLACVFWPGSVSLSKQSTNSNIDSTTTSCFMTKWLKLQNFIKISYFFKFGNIGFFIMTFHQQNLETTGVWKLASVVSNRNAGGASAELWMPSICFVWVLMTNWSARIWGRSIWELLLSKQLPSNDLNSLKTWHNSFRLTPYPFFGQCCVNTDFYLGGAYLKHKKIPNFRVLRILEPLHINFISKSQLQSKGTEKSICSFCRTKFNLTIYMWNLYIENPFKS